MTNLEETAVITQRLLDEFQNHIDSIVTLDLTSACHVLLCARDLEVLSHGLEARLNSIATTPLNHEQESGEVVAAFIRQITLPLPPKQWVETGSNRRVAA